MASPSLAARAAILGVPYQPGKRPDPLGVVKAFEALDAKAMATSSGAIVRDTLVDLNAVSNPPAHQIGWVTGDATPAKNGIYENAGSPSAPDWQRRADLPFGLIHMINVGAGTADAIVATSSLPAPTAPGAALFTISIATDNTGPVTINGKPLRTNSGNEIVPGGLSAPSMPIFVDLGDHYRLLSDQASASIVVAAEGWANQAEAAADEAKNAAGEATGRALIYPDNGPEVYNAGGRRIGQISDPVDDLDAVNRRSALIKIGGAFAAGGLPITGLADGVDDSDAATVGQMQSRVARRAGPVTMPNDFDWPANAGQSMGKFPIQIVRSPDGTYRSEYVSPYPPTLIGAPTGTKRYIHGASGDDGADGLTPQTALKTIDQADTLSGVLEMDIAPGNIIGSWTAGLTRSQLYMSSRGKVRLITGVLPPAWANVGAGIYSAAVAASPAVTTVVNERQSDEFGFPLALPRYADLAALQLVDGPGFAHVGGTLYIRLDLPRPGYPFVSGGHAVPQGNDVIVLTRGGNHPRLNAGSRYYFKNIEFWGGDFAFQLNGPDGATNSNAHVAFEDCDFAFAYADGVSIWNGIGGAWFKRCRAFRNGRDGFNYHDTGSSRRTLAIEDGCIGVGNGFNASNDQHQGSSNHDNGRVIRINGIYGGGRGGDVVDIGNSQSWNISSAAIGSRAVSQNNRNGWETQGNAEMWLDGCSSFGSHSAVLARDTSTIYTRDLSYDGLLTQDGGSIIAA